MLRDGTCNSLWQPTTPTFEAKKTPKASEVYDVLIVGGGITGVTTALLLQKSGKRCVLAEAHTLGFGTTGGTTAHLNTFMDTPYHTIKKKFGVEGARLVALGAKAAISFIKQQVTEYRIDCSFKELPAFLFALNHEQSEELEKMVKVAQELDVEMDFADINPFPIPHLRNVIIEHQAQFHPTRYLLALAKAFEKAGGTVLQNCRVTGVKETDPLEVATTAQPIKARQLIYATHIPPGVNLLDFRCAPYRSYAIAVTLKKGEYPNALGYDMQDPYHYYRSEEVDGIKYMIAGGEDHKTGHQENTEACFRRLESHIRSYFEVDVIPYRWSSQYFEAADGLPYIGRLPGTPENVFVATGFGGNGMIYGTLSGIILSNMITLGNSIYQDLFDPNRIKPVASFANFVKEAADVIGTFIGGRISTEKLESVLDLAAGEGRVVKYEGHTLAIYKDEQHRLHAINAACSHIKCTIAWNAAEKTWDCPCHGSRFSIDGEMLTGPARKDLEQLKWRELEKH